ncbi:MAG TPA: xanthine dehydrogenase family protein molybdopterin-binding subunit [Solirubrobacter sp.]|nr:xanthine dehydrogenase family protein molybdopterin-binding subunit [Solirubrobacter sp.]
MRAEISDGVPATRPAHLGEDHRGPEVMDKLTGRAVFTGDMQLPGMLHAALVTSPVPRGVIRGVDGSAARALPGVVAVVTAADLREEPIGCRDVRYGVAIRDRPILAEDRVTFVGEPVAAVVAATRAAARAAAGAVQLDIVEQEAAGSLESALAADAPIVHPDGFEPEDAVYHPPAPVVYGSSNVIMSYETSKGDVDAAFARATTVVEGTFTFPAIYQYAMEPFCAVAAPGRDEINVWSTAQHPYQVQRDLARLYGLPLSDVHVHSTLLGGGFGSKSFTHIEPLTIALARAVGRPVRLELDIAQATKISRRHNARSSVRVALDGEGDVSGYDAELHLDTGSYTLLGPWVAKGAAFRALGGYDFPAYRVRSHLVVTNTSPAGSMRAVGGPQGAWGLEVQLDCAARAAGVDPFELRRRLVAERGQEFRPGRTPMDALLADDLDDLRQLADAMPSPPARGLRVGRGMAMGIADPGSSPVSTAICRLAEDGSITVLIGSTELGQGTRAVAAQIAAATLDVDTAIVSVASLDTGRGTYDATTGASRSTIMSGLAVHRAAAQVRERVVRMAADEWECAAADVAIRAGSVEGPGGRAKPIGRFVPDHFGESGGTFFGVGEVTWKDFPTTPAFWEVAMGAATVGVDEQTGQVHVLSYASLADVGRVVNPVQMRGQEQGAFIQGLGHALMESLEFEAGYPMNDSLVDYHVPRAGDVPPAQAVQLVENHDGAGAFGIKGGGEGAIMPVAPAVANAVFDAIGVRIGDLPLTPERVWRAMRGAGR